MQIIKEVKGFTRVNRLLEWMIYMLGYTIVFIIVSNLFDSLYIDIEHSYIYSFLTVFIVYLLNITIKPILVTLTIPITGLTLGLFYPFINLFILKLTDWILGSHFDLNNFWIALWIAILISIMNFFMEGFIIKPIVRRVKRNE